ncbi:MAG: PHP domain-containing protein [Chitinivibrionales bacterium]|nr:PHP domain-containing protein [Chitinivibrionales bacterium]
MEYLTLPTVCVILRVYVKQIIRRNEERMQRGSRYPKRYVDLHVHTSLSDGTNSVQEVLRFACQKNLKAISITDHDCIDAYPLALELGGELGIEVIPGVELSSEIAGADIHILGYFVDVRNAALNRKIQAMKDARYRRAKKIVKNLNRQGVDLRFETVLSIAGEGAIGRPHIATALLREELVYSFKQAFEDFLGYDCPAYVEKLKLCPEEVFALIRNAGGVPVMAHPGVTGVDERLPEFMQKGMVGIEVYHSEHTSAQEEKYLRFCKAHNLAYSGGSDYHNNNHLRSEIGSKRVSYAAVKSLKERR